MTSPAQLQYLDAIGIPVWVSRDLVQDRIIEDFSREETATQENLQGDRELQNNNIKRPAARQSQEIGSNNHVSSLLNDLDARQKPHTTPLGHSNTETKNQPVSKPINKNKTSKQATEIGRTLLHTVFACGDLNADWMIIGESPDMSSNGQEQPYAGDSWVLLSNMLRAVGVAEPRTQTYLINILKNSSNNDANIETSEKQTLNHLLLEKVKQVNPKMLLVIGQIAAQNLLNTKEPLVRLRGKTHLLGDKKIPLIVTYYPSYLLSKPLDKRKAWEDLKLAMKTIA